MNAKTTSLAKGTRVYADGLGLGRIEKVSHRKGATFYTVGCVDTVGVYAEHEVLEIAADPEFAALVAAAAETRSAVDATFFDGEMVVDHDEHKRLVAADDAAYRALVEAATVALSAQKAAVRKQS